MDKKILTNVLGWLNKMLRCVFAYFNLWAYFFLFEVITLLLYTIYFYKNGLLVSDVRNFIFIVSAPIGIFFAILSRNYEGQKKWESLKLYLKNRWEEKLKSMYGKNYEHQLIISAEAKKISDRTSGFMYLGLSRKFWDGDELTFEKTTDVLFSKKMFFILFTIYIVVIYRMNNYEYITYANINNYYESFIFQFIIVILTFFVLTMTIIRYFVNSKKDIARRLG